jgi:serine/threonine protein kinase
VPEEGIQELSPLDGPVRPTDDTPTIISRNATQRPAHPEDIGNGIRGRHLAHFELIEPIGVGGMAAVLRARDTQLDRMVALKILPPEMAADPENVLRFHQEARSAAKLDHENIARVFFCGEDQRLHFIAFEFVEGDNLRTILERRGRLPVSECLHYLVQVTAGLIHAARRGVVHRDIKPSNIIITPNGRAKLVDMGLARCLEPQEDRGLTQSGVTLGTFDYISPEQALEPRDADVRSDIYSLGCTFYHMLTGRPPVPEGTAAKKLHHHQHVKPTDPRQLVSGLPDEAAVILDRMMAKSPRDRYQTPEDLLQALLAAVQNLGTSQEMTEGVIAVETELPNRPAGRPLLLVAVAALAVVGLILLLDQTPSKPPPFPDSHANGSAHDSAVTKEPIPDKSTLPAKTPSPPDQPGVVTATYQPPAEPTVSHLNDWLRANQDADRLVIPLAGDLDLSTWRGLIIKARQRVEIRPAKPGDRPTLRFAYDQNAGEETRVALTIEAPVVVVQGIRFVLDARGTFDTALVALRLQGGQAGVDGCEFLQARPGLKSEKLRVASLVFEARKSLDSLRVRECCFLGFGQVTEGRGKKALSGPDFGGQDALVRQGPGLVEVENCVFGPHSATFRLENKLGGESRPFKVSRTSILAARRSAVFDVQEGVSAELDLAQTVVARVEGSRPAQAEAECCPAVLVREETSASGVKFVGTDNRYFDLDAFWVMGSNWQKAGWGEFTRRTRIESSPSRLLLQRPWKLDADHQRAALEAGQPEQAFELSERWVDLRTENQGEKTLLGAQKALGRSCVPTPLLTATEIQNQADGRQLVVEPDEDDSPNGIYQRLDLAISLARPRDQILLRHTGIRDCSPLRLDHKEMSDLTIRPCRGFRPVLALGSTSEREAALFQVHGGKLRLEGVDFLIRPTRAEARQQAVVALVGNGECLFRKCLITLDRNAREANLAVATLPEIGKSMSVDLPVRSTDQGPLLTLDACFIRGEGDLLWSRSARPCELIGGDSLVALRGSLLNMEVGPDSAAPALSQKVQLTLNRLTTYLGSLIHLSVSKESKGSLPVCCKPTGCLFVPAPSARALIQLDAPETGEKALKEKLNWIGGINAYGTFSTLVEQQESSPEAMPQPPLSSGRWGTLMGEESSLYGIKVPSWPGSDVPFVEMEADKFKNPLEADKFKNPAEADIGATGAQIPRGTPK